MLLTCTLRLYNKFSLADKDVWFWPAGRCCLPAALSYVAMAWHALVSLELNRIHLSNLSLAI